MQFRLRIAIELRMNCTWFQRSSRSGGDTSGHSHFRSEYLFSSCKTYPKRRRRRRRRDSRTPYNCCMIDSLFTSSFQMQSFSWCPPRHLHWSFCIFLFFYSVWVSNKMPRSLGNNPKSVIVTPLFACLGLRTENTFYIFITHERFARIASNQRFAILSALQCDSRKRGSIWGDSRESANRCARIRPSKTGTVSIA